MAKKNGKMEAIKNAPGVYRRDGHLVVKWWEPDGKGGGTRKQETLPPGTSLKQAKLFKSDKERAKAKPRRREITCDEAVDRWMIDFGQGRSGSTRKQHSERVSKFGKDFAGRQLASIDRAEARLWANANDSRMKTVRAMFNDYKRDGYIEENPFIGIQRRQQERGREDIVVLTEPELERLIAIANDLFGEYGRVIAGLIGFAGWTGGRPGELYALEHDDVDLVNKQLHITAAYSSTVNGQADPKWNSKRRIALLPQAEEIYRQIPRHPFSNLVFWSQRGKQFNARLFHHYWKQIRATFWSGLPKSRKAYDEIEAVRERKIPPGFDLYELRHSYASYLANVLGASSREIAKQMGHKDGGRLAERLYVHTEDDDANRSILERAKLVADEAERKRAAG